jgi:hypothetical protein
VVEEDKLQSIYEIEEELIRKFTQAADIAWEKQQQQRESEDNTEREHVDPKTKHTKKDHKKSKHKHKSNRRKSEHTVTQKHT